MGDLPIPRLRIALPAGRSAVAQSTRIAHHLLAQTAWRGTGGIEDKAMMLALHCVKSVDHLIGADHIM